MCFLGWQRIYQSAGTASSHDELGRKVDWWRNWVLNWWCWYRRWWTDKLWRILYHDDFHQVVFLLKLWWLLSSLFFIKIMKWNAFLFLLLFWMGDGAARHCSALCGTEPRRAASWPIITKNSKYFFFDFFLNDIFNNL